MSGPFAFCTEERHITVSSPPAYDAESYQADTHKAGMAEAIVLLREGRPGGALHRLARTVTDEMACLGYPGIRVPITVGMTRVIHAKRVREARRAVLS